MIVQEPEQRLTLDNVLDHAWFDDLKDYDPVDTIRFTDDLIHDQYDNPNLLKKLEGLGFRTDRIMLSVKTNACDSLSALWHFISMNSKTSSQKLHSSGTNVEVPEMNFSSPLQRTPVSPVKGPRGTGWGEFPAAPSLIAIRRNMRENPVLDRTRSMSATTSEIRRKKKNIIEEGEEDLLF
jgi:hypothetical protein